jgi:hypothetical protein
MRNYTKCHTGGWGEGGSKSTKKVSMVTNTNLSFLGNGDHYEGGHTEGGGGLNSMEVSCFIRVLPYTNLSF